MIHIRVDDEELNSKRRFACGLGPDLPKGDVYYFQSEAHRPLMGLRMSALPAYTDGDECTCGAFAADNR